jgi:hypothetical protein
MESSTQFARDRSSLNRHADLPPIPLLPYLNLVASVWSMPTSKRTRQLAKNPNGQFEEDVEVAASSEISYEEGPPRKHHFLYFPSGDIVIQVSVTFKLSDSQTTVGLPLT